MTKLDTALAALADMPLPQLRAEWSNTHREEAPDLPIDLLRRGVAYRLQERRRGVLTSAARRRLAALAQEMKGSGSLSPAPEIELKTGTRLVREWHGTMHHVLVLEDGFLFEDRRYTSLTRIAADITGTSWSGPRFFGLRPRRKAFGGGGERE